MSMMCPTDTDPTCANDKIVGIIKELFGEDFINAFFNSGKHPALVEAGDKLMPIIASNLANASLFVTIILLVFTFYKWVIDSSNDGEAHGLTAEKGSILGMIGRPLFSVMMLSPTLSGYPIIHIIIMAIVLNANGMANKFYQAYTERDTNIAKVIADLDNPATNTANDMLRPTVYGALHGYCWKLANSMLDANVQPVYGSDKIIRAESFSFGDNPITTITRNMSLEDVPQSGKVGKSGVVGSICGTFSNTYRQNPDPIPVLGGSDPTAVIQQKILTAVSKLGMEVTRIRQRQIVIAYVSGFRVAYGTSGSAVQNLISTLMVGDDGDTISNYASELITVPGVNASGWTITDVQASNTSGGSASGTGSTSTSNQEVIPHVQDLIAIAEKAKKQTVDGVEQVVKASGFGAPTGTVTKENQYSANPELNNLINDLNKAILNGGWATSGTNRSKLTNFRTALQTTLNGRPYDASLPRLTKSDEQDDNLNKFIEKFTQVRDSVIAATGDKAPSDFSDFTVEATVADMEANGKNASALSDNMASNSTNFLLRSEKKSLEYLTGTGNNNVDALSRIQSVGETFLIAAVAFDTMLIAASSGFIPLKFAAGNVAGQASGGYSFIQALWDFLINILTPRLMEIRDFLFTISRVFGVVIPTMPYIFLIMAAVGWILQIIQTLFGMPLFFIMHAIPQSTFIGNQQQGYVTLVSLFFRPIIIISAFFLAFALYDPMLTYLTQGFIAMHGQVVGSDSTNSFGRLMTMFFSFKYYWMVYAAALMMLTYLIFGLVQELADSVLNWLGTNLLHGFGNLETSGIMKDANANMKQSQANSGKALMDKMKKNKKKGGDDDDDKDTKGGKGGGNGGGNGGKTDDGYDNADNQNRNPGSTGEADNSANDNANNQKDNPEERGIHYTRDGTGTSAAVAFGAGAVLSAVGAAKGMYNRAADKNETLKAKSAADLAAGKKISSLRQAKDGLSVAASGVRGALIGATQGLNLGSSAYGSKNQYVKNRDYFDKNVGFADNEGVKAARLQSSLDAKNKEGSAAKEEEANAEEQRLLGYDPTDNSNVSVAGGAVAGMIGTDDSPARIEHDGAVKSDGGDDDDTPPDGSPDESGGGKPDENVVGGSEELAALNGDDMTPSHAVDSDLSSGSTSNLSSNNSTDDLSTAEGSVSTNTNPVVTDDVTPADSFDSSTLDQPDSQNVDENVIANTATNTLDDEVEPSNEMFNGEQLSGSDNENENVITNGTVGFDNNELAEGDAQQPIVEVDSLADSNNNPDSQSQTNLDGNSVIGNQQQVEVSSDGNGIEKNTAIAGAAVAGLAAASMMRDAKFSPVLASNGTANKKVGVPFASSNPASKNKRDTNVAAGAKKANTLDSQRTNNATRQRVNTSRQAMAVGGAFGAATALANTSKNAKFTNVAQSMSGLAPTGGAPFRPIRSESALNFGNNTANASQGERVLGNLSSNADVTGNKPQGADNPVTASAVGGGNNRIDTLSPTADVGTNSPVTASAVGGGNNPIDTLNPTADVGGGSTPVSASAVGGGNNPIDTLSPTAAVGGGNNPIGTSNPTAAVGGGSTPVSASVVGGGNNPIDTLNPTAAVGGGSTPVSASAVGGGSTPVSASAVGGGNNPIGTSNPTASVGGGSTPVSASAVGGNNPIDTSNPTAAVGGGSTPVSASDASYQSRDGNASAIQGLNQASLNYGAAFSSNNLSNQLVDNPVSTSQTTSVTMGGATQNDTPTTNISNGAALSPKPQSASPVTSNTGVGASRVTPTTTVGEQARNQVISALNDSTMGTQAIQVDEQATNQAATSERKRRNNNLASMSVSNAAETPQATTTVDMQPTVNRLTGAVAVDNGDQMSVFTPQELSTAMGMSSNNPNQGLAGVDTSSDFLVTGNNNPAPAPATGNGGLVNNTSNVFMGESHINQPYQALSATEAKLSGGAGSYSQPEQVSMPKPTIEIKPNSGSEVSLNNIMQPNPLSASSDKTVDSSQINASAPTTDVKPSDKE